MMWTNKFVHNPKVHFNYFHVIKKLYNYLRNDLLNLIEIVDVSITSVWGWGSAFNSFVFWFMIFTIALDRPGIGLFLCFSSDLFSEFLHKLRFQKVV